MTQSNKNIVITEATSKLAVIKVPPKQYPTFGGICCFDEVFAPHL